MFANKVSAQSKISHLFTGIFNQFFYFIFNYSEKQTSAKKAPPKPIFDPLNISLPYVLTTFVDERLQNRVCLKIHLLSGMEPQNIKATCNSHQVILSCRYQSAFISPIRHRECFITSTGEFLFSKTDTRIVAFGADVDKLVKDQDGEVWGQMIVDLPFACETDFYDEDVVPGYEIIRCDSSYFLNLSLVGAEQKKPKKQQKNTTIRIVPQRRFRPQAYKTPPNAPPPTKYPKPKVYKKRSNYNTTTKNNCASSRHKKPLFSNPTPAPIFFSQPSPPKKPQPPPPPPPKHSPINKLKPSSPPGVKDPPLQLKQGSDNTKRNYSCLSGTQTNLLLSFDSQDASTLESTEIDSPTKRQRPSIGLIEDGIKLDTIMEDVDDETTTASEKLLNYADYNSLTGSDGKEYDFRTDCPNAARLEIAYSQGKNSSISGDEEEELEEVNFEQNCGDIVQYFGEDASCEV